jgi:transcriptional regulator with XRE-family HTH domain
MNTKIKRIIKKITQKELAKMVGTSHVTIAKIENGNIDNVKFGTLKKIATCLNSSVEELFLAEEN